jgi:RNA polymerase sigma-70 factor (ECF subfamily)
VDRQAPTDVEASRDIRLPKAYLSAIVTRLCLDRLKAARATREHSIGPWLPEPVLTTDATDIHAVVEQHEAITQAFLVLLEHLTPPERAVFVLREVFEYPYADIAAMLHMSQANCRHIFHRARQQLAEQRTRYPAASAQQQALVERFLAATQRGDVHALQDVLAADVQLWADSGGKARAPQRMVQGRDEIAKLFPIFATNIMHTVGGCRLIGAGVSLSGRLQQGGICCHAVTQGAWGHLGASTPAAAYDTQLLQSDA